MLQEGVPGTWVLSSWKRASPGFWVGGTRRGCQLPLESEQGTPCRNFEVFWTSLCLMSCERHLKHRETKRKLSRVYFILAAEYMQHSHGDVLARKRHSDQFCEMQKWQQWEQGSIALQICWQFLGNLLGLRRILGVKHCSSNLFSHCSMNLLPKHIPVEVKDWLNNLSSSYWSVLEKILMCGKIISLP